jgi:hypothetical protein
LVAAYQTFQAPAPVDPAAKTAAAAATFKTLFLTCVSIAHIAAEIADRFTFHLTHRDHWQDGITGTGTIENPTAAAVDKFIIEHAPPQTRDILSQANRALNPALTVARVCLAPKAGEMRDLIGHAVILRLASRVVQPEPVKKSAMKPPFVERWLYQ